MDWWFDEDDRVVDTKEDFIGYTLEDVAAAMVELGWITPSNWRTDFNPIPLEEDGSIGSSVAEEVRGKLNREGKYAARWATRSAAR